MSTKQYADMTNEDMVAWGLKEIATRHEEGRQVQAREIPRATAMWWQMDRCRAIGASLAQAYFLCMHAIHESHACNKAVK